MSAWKNCGNDIGNGYLDKSRPSTSGSFYDVLCPYKKTRGDYYGLLHILKLDIFADIIFVFLHQDKKQISINYLYVSVRDSSPGKGKLYFAHYKIKFLLFLLFGSTPFPLIISFVLVNSPQSYLLMDIISDGLLSNFSLNYADARNAKSMHSLYYIYRY